MTEPAYTVHSVEDLSTDASQRLKVSIIVPAGTTPDTLLHTINNVIEHAANRSFLDTVTEGHIEVVFVYAFTDPADVSVKVAPWRAVYVREGVDETVVPSELWSSKQVEMLDGRVMYTFAKE